MKKITVILGILLFIYIMPYFAIIFLHQHLPLNKYLYVNAARHYKTDTRIERDKFELTNALGQYDAQWYLEIAENGYPNKSENTNNNLGKYAFFPIYPLLIRGTNYIFHDIEFSAFILTQLLSIGAIASCLYSLKKTTTTSIAIKTTALLLLFPFSIFLRGYFTESLQLMELAWLIYFLMKKRWTSAALTTSICTATKGTTLLLIPVLIFLLLKEYKAKKISIKKAVMHVLISMVGLAIWSLFCYLKTGNPIMFITVRTLWTGFENPLILLTLNLYAIINIFALPWHYFKASKIDVILVISVAIVLWISRKKMPKEFWLISFALWILPITTSTLMSYSRYQSLSLPLFYYLAKKSTKKSFIGITAAFTVCLTIVSLLFINWYWIG